MKSVAFELRHPRSDGTTHVVLEPLQFLARLCALVPPPRQHQLRDFGVLASASPLRLNGVNYSCR
ncbi:MAG: transposase [Deltaproteobacteria bacterium]|nr:transposase [Deltaproteobacteria bacterium]